MKPPVFEYPGNADSRNIYFFKMEPIFVLLRIGFLGPKWPGPRKPLGACQQHLIATKACKKNASFFIAVNFNKSLNLV